LPADPAILAIAARGPHSMHPYRTHTCGEPRRSHAGSRVRLSGWVHRRRDHGQLLFVDLRDNYGITQCVIDISSPLFAALESVRVESVVTVTGTVVPRAPETVNATLATGEVELRVEELEVRSRAAVLPLQVASDEEAGEEIRLRYRYLDLRREKMHRNILLRSQVIASIRRRMIEQGFTEFQTPILTASSPEGARDYLVPSRIHPGKFYALPQAPQMFKQLLMVAGFDRYFQIAPCFRDEDSRADRSPGEFYQLDFEMSFVTQDDVFAAIEPVIAGVFEEFANYHPIPDGRRRAVTKTPFPRIAYDDSMLRYGSDKPDLRNPIEIHDVTEAFRGSGFGIFARAIEGGAVVRAIPAPGAWMRPRSFFDKLNEWARGTGAAGLGYIIFAKDERGKGPIAKNLDGERLNQIKAAAGLEDGDAVFFACDQAAAAARLAGAARIRLWEELEDHFFAMVSDGKEASTHLEKQCLAAVGIANDFRFCWIVDYPMYERNEETGKIEFSHNPFSMPQGGLEALESQDPLTIKAFQYDIVCNGVELSSGAIRNHLPEIMYKAFAIAGYPQDEVEARFSGLLTALKFGAPPHGGSAPGIDRIVMLLANEPNIREIVTFPMNQKAEDLMILAPARVPAERLKELYLRLELPPE
jgi:aspartyl-tRNA synthetase